MQIEALATGVDPWKGAGTPNIRPRGATAAAVAAEKAAKAAKNRDELFGKRATPAVMLRRNSEWESTVAAELGAVAASLDALRRESAEHTTMLENIERLTTRALARIDSIFSISKDILSITTATLTGVESLVSRARSGDRSLVRDLIMNEWFALATIFFLRPHLPVTIETISPLWGYIVTAGFTQRLLGSVRRRDINLSFEGGPIRAVFNLLSSAPNAIFLIFSLSNRWNTERAGSTGYGTNICRPRDESSSLESLLVSSFSSMVESFRIFLSFKKTSSSPAPGVSYTFDFFKEKFEYCLTTFPRLMDQLREMDPLLFGTIPGTALLFARWAMGQLYIVVTDTARTVLQVPTYLQQSEDVMKSELWLLGAIIGFIYDITGNAFKDLFRMIKDSACLSMCAAKSYLDTEYSKSSYLNPKTPIYGFLSVTLGFILSAIGCACPTVGGSRKTKRRQYRHMKRGSRRNRRHSRRVQRGGSAATDAQGEIISLQRDLLLIQLLPWITGGKYHIDPDKLSEIETRASALFSNLIIENKWLPPLVVEGIETLPPLLYDQTEETCK